MGEYKIISGSPVFPAGLKEIGRYAFEGRGDVAAADVPEGVASIGACAFIGCRGLVGARLPESLENIGERAFEDCTALSHIKLPPKMTAVRRSAFYGCSSLTGAELPPSVKIIEEWAFAECAGLARLDLPEGLLSIRNGAFENCASLKEINIPPGVTEIGKDTFNGCDALVSITADVGGRRRRVDFPAIKRGFAFFYENPGETAYARYNISGETVITRISAGGDKTFATGAENAGRNYGPYLMVEGRIAELFNWLDIRDGLGSSMRRVTIPPAFALSAVGFREADITAFFRFRKPHFLRLCRSPRFVALNAEAKTDVAKLFAALGGFTGVNSEAETAVAAVHDIMKNLSEAEIHKYFDGLPRGCAPAPKKAIPLFAASVADKSFIEIAARYLAEYRSISDDYAATSDKMVEKIRGEQDEGARNIMKAKLKDFKIDVDFINRYIAKHRLHVKNGELAAAIARFGKDVTQGEADFLDDLYEKAQSIEIAAARGARGAAKLYEPGVEDGGGERFVFRWAGALDADLYTLGYSTDCCFKPPDNTGAAVLGEAVASADVWPLIVYDAACGAESGTVAAFAIVNYNEDEKGLLIDNIEVAPEYQRRGLDAELLSAFIRGVGAMRNAMEKNGRPLSAINVKYDPFNDLNAEIERALPEAATSLRCRIYTYGAHTYASGGDRPQRSVV